VFRAPLKNFQPAQKSLIVDTRPAALFRNSYLPGAINIQGNGQLETWWGTLVAPESKFYLVAADQSGLYAIVIQELSANTKHFNYTQTNN
jgi:hydroxyacylglutathione hydrolase